MRSHKNLAGDYRAAFTLIELMIVIAIIAIIAAVAIPNLIESRITAAESAAATSLRAGIFSGQETFRSAVHNDIDNDNKGEYGHVGHLAGAIDTWGNPELGMAGTYAGQIAILGEDYAGADVARLQPGSTFDAVNGYWYAGFLDADSSLDYLNSLAEERQVNNSELYYCVVAVPEAFNDTGRRAFAVTNGGKVLTSPGTDIYERNPSEVLNRTVNGVGCFDDVGSGVTVQNRNPAWNVY